MVTPHDIFTAVKFLINSFNFFILTFFFLKYKDLERIRYATYRHSAKYDQMWDPVFFISNTKLGQIMFCLFTLIPLSFCRSYMTCISPFSFFLFVLAFILYFTSCTDYFYVMGLSVCLSVFVLPCQQKL